MSWSSDSSRIPPEQQIRNSLIRSLDANGATPSTFLDLLDAVTQPPGKDSAFRKLQDRHGQPFRKLIDFVTTERPEGLGLHSRDDLTKHLALQHKEEREPFRRQATVDRMAAMRQRVESLLHEETEPELPLGGDRRSSDFQSRVTRLKPSGESDQAEYVVARLKRDARHDPVAAEWAAKVIGGEVKPNAAARQMGWRKPRVVLAKPETVAKALIEHMPRDALQYIADELTDHLKEN